MSKQESEFQTILISVSKNLHTLMREYAKRKRIKIGLAYDQALNHFLSQTANYMGTKRQHQLKKG